MQPTSNQIVQKSYENSYVPIRRANGGDKCLTLIKGLLLLVPVGGWIAAAIMNRQNKRRLRTYLCPLANLRLSAMQNAVKHIDPEMLKLPKNFNDPSFRREFIHLRRQMNPKHIKFKQLPKHTVRMQTTLAKIYKTKTYQSLAANKQNHPVIEYIENIAVACRTEAKGVDLFKMYGRDIKRNEIPKFNHPQPINGCHSWNQLGSLLNRGFNAHFNQSFDGVVETIFWMLFHVSQVFTGIATLGALGTDPVKMSQPFRRGNFNVHTGDYVLKTNSMKRRMHFFHGPGCGVSSDRLADLHVERMKKHGGFHLQHSLEHPVQHGEEARQLHIKGLQDKSEGHFRFFATPCNGKAWNSEGGFAKWTTSADFFRKYKNLAVTGDENVDESDQKAYRVLEKKNKQNTNGFYIGPDVMSDEQFENAFKYCAWALSDESLKSNAYYQKMIHGGPVGQKMVSKGMQLFVQAMVASGAIVKTTLDAQEAAKINKDLDKELDKMLTFGQACTADVDRGVAVNIATRLIIMRQSGQKLTPEVVTELLGTTLGRAELTFDRRIMLDKFEGLSAFIYLLGSHDPNRIDLTIKAYINNCFLSGSDVTTTFEPDYVAPQKK